MEILQQLGANSTAIIQFIIFSIAITILTLFIFNPFYKAYDMRLQKTKGADNVAKEAIEESKNLSLIYQTQLRDQAEKIKNTFDLHKKEAQILSDESLQKAKAESEVYLKKSRTELDSEINQTKSKLAQFSKEISEELIKKMESGL